MESRNSYRPLLVLTALFFGACGGDESASPAKLIDGKTKAEWTEAANADDPQQKAEALRALARCEEPPIELFEAHLEAKDPQVRVAAILCLGTAGPAAAEWATDLASYLEEDEEGMSPEGRKAIRNAAIHTLGKIGPEAFPALAHLLASRDTRHRQRAVFAIRPFVAELEDGTRVLLPLVQDDDWFVRREAVRGLGEAGKGDERAQEALLEALGDDNAEVVRYAALAIGGIGGRSDREGRALKGLLVRHQAGIRAAAAYGLGLMADEAAPFAEDVLDLLKNDSKREVRVQAALAHYRITGDAAEALPVLTKNIPCQDPGICRDALRALKELGPDAASTVPKLILLLDKPKLRALAVAALGAIGPGAKDAVPALEQAAAGLGAGDSAMAAEIETALGAIGGAD